MGSAIDIAKVSARGSLALSVGMIVSNVVMAIGTLVMASFLPTNEYGLYAVVLVPSAFFNLFQDLGINSAIIKYTAQYRSEGKDVETKKIIAFGLIFNVAIGASLSLIAYLLAGFLADYIFHRPHIQGLLKVMSITILLSSLLRVAQSVFVGFERMEFYSATMILQSLLRGTIAPLLVVLGYGLFGAVIGLVISSIASSTLGLFLTIIFFYRRIDASIGNLEDFPNYISFMLKYGLPVSASLILTGLQTQFYNFLMAIYCTDQMIANYQMAVNFTVLINFFVFPIMTVLFPAFSKLSPQKGSGTLRTVFKFSVKYSALIVLPVSMAIMALSKPLVFTLFGEKFNFAPQFLSLLVIVHLYVGLGSLSIPNLINGQGRTDVTFKLTLLNLIVGLPLSLILIPRLGILGLIVTTLISKFPSVIVGLWWVKKNFLVTVDVKNGSKIYLASITSGIIAFLTIQFLSYPYWVSLLAGGVTFLIVYVASLIVLKAITVDDVNNLREALSGLGPLYKLADIPLSLVERLLKTPAISPQD